jgi:hypothetical protein
VDGREAAGDGEDHDVSGTDAFPPPGAPGPAEPPLAPPGWGPPPPGWGPPPPGWGPPPPAWGAPPPLPAAHKPGVIPLKPLTLGDLYNGAFRMIRVNPGATVGSAVLVSVASMAIPLVLVALATVTFDLGSWTEGAMTETEVLGEVGSVLTSLFGSLLQWFGLIFVTGMIAHVAMTAAVGQRITLGEAWARTHGRRWRLVGLSLLLGFGFSLLLGIYVLLWVVVVLTGELAVIVVWALLSIPAFVCLMVWAWVRFYYLAVPPMMVEGLGIFDAISRGYALTAAQFWRTLGIGLLTSLVTGLAASVLAVPVTLVAVVVPLVVEGNAGVFLMLLLQSLGTILSTAFVAPFTAGVVSLQYVDQRIRKEAYDVELLALAGQVAA